MSALANNHGEITLAKKELRRRMRAERAARCDAERESASAKICERLSDLSHLAKMVAVYLATPSEPNIDAFTRRLQQDGVLAVAPQSSGEDPRFLPIADDWSNVQESPNGVRAPMRSDSIEFISPEKIDAVIAPGLAFDARGTRLGQGGGWYDRVLAQLRPGVLVVGVCFDFQVVEWVPCETHDQPVTVIVTEARTIPIA